jgi:hypothetical protein
VNNPFISFSEALVEAKLGNQNRRIITISVGKSLRMLKMKLSISICGIWILNNEKFEREIDLSKTNSIEDSGVNGKVDFNDERLFSFLFIRFTR